MILEHDALMYDVYKYVVVLATILLVVVMPYCVIYMIAANHINEMNAINAQTQTPTPTPVSLGNLLPTVIPGITTDTNTTHVQYYVYDYSTPTPTTHPALNTGNVTSTPSAVATPPDTYYPPGSKYNPTVSGYWVTPTPKPIYTTHINNQSLGDFSFVKCNGLNTNFKLSDNTQFNRDTPVTLNFNVTNLLLYPIHNMNATVTVAEYVIDTSTNQPALSKTYTAGYGVSNLNVQQYNDYTLGIQYTTPDTPKQYLLMCNIHGDNGAYLQIQEVITIK